MNFAKIGIACAAALLLSACANGYERFYQPIQYAPGSISATPFVGEPKLISGSGDPKQDVNVMYSRGYGAIGFASFNGPQAGPAAALAAAKQVGAEFVVVAAKYSNTVSGAIPITTPTATTSYSQGSVNAYGTGGSAFGTYNGTTTTYGSQTNYIPYSIARYDQSAVFFAPLARHGAGIMVVNVPDEVAQQIGTQKGALVRAVRRDSPAFNADILPGDIIVAVNGSEVSGAASLIATLPQILGQPTAVSVLRGGQTIIKTITVPVGDW